MNKIKKYYKFILLSILIVFIFKINYLMDKGWFGYKIDYSDKEIKINSEINEIIHPFKISSIGKSKRGAIHSIYYTIPIASYYDYNEIYNILINNNKYGFNSICRKNEYLYIYKKNLDNPPYSVIVEWRYPDESCLKSNLSKQAVGTVSRP